MFADANIQVETNANEFNPDQSGGVFLMCVRHELQHLVFAPIPHVKHPSLDGI
jgi:hypothetical protein